MTPDNEKVTKLDLTDYITYVCNFCGAHAHKPELIAHFKGCIKDNPKEIANLNRMVEENLQALQEGDL